jgi:hypothetical protein
VTSAAAAAGAEGAARDIHGLHHWRLGGRATRQAQRLDGTRGRVQAKGRGTAKACENQNNLHGDKLGYGGGFTLRWMGKSFGVKLQVAIR